jgi:hypothetical protein
MISDFEHIFNQWSDKIQTNLDRADDEKKDDKDAHPL